MAKLWRGLARKGSDLVRAYTDAKLPSTRKALVRQYNTGISTYLKLPGIAGNYASTPDAAPLDITDGVLRLEARAYVAALGVNSGLVAKWDLTGGQASYSLILSASNLISFNRSTTGANSGSKASTETHPFAAGEVGWFSSAWDIDGGTIDFETSLDGVTWTALGTQGQAFATAPFSSTAPLEIGTRQLGTLVPLTGGIYRVRVLHNGTAVFDADFTKGPIGASSIVETVNNAVVTINSTGAPPAAVVDGAT